MNHLTTMTDTYRGGNAARINSCCCSAAWRRSIEGVWFIGRESRVGREPVSSAASLHGLCQITKTMKTSCFSRLKIYIHSLMKDRKKWRPRRHSPNQLRNTGKLRKRGKRLGIGGRRGGRGRKELTASWKKISKAGAIGSKKAMRKVGRGR